MGGRVASVGSREVDIEGFEWDVFATAEPTLLQKFSQIVSRLLCNRNSISNSTSCRIDIVVAGKAKSCLWSVGLSTQLSAAMSSASCGEVVEFHFPFLRIPIPESVHVVHQKALKRFGERKYILSCSRSFKESLADR